MAREGGGAGSVVLGPIVGGILSQRRARKERKRRKHQFHERQRTVLRALEAADQTPATYYPQPSLGAGLVGRLGDLTAAGATGEPLPVLRAQQAGTPPQTGSGIPSPPPRPGSAVFLDYMLALLDVLRAYGVRLPWDPRVPRGGGAGGITINLPPLELPSVNAFPELTAGLGDTMANVWGSILSAGGELLGGVLRGATGVPSTSGTIYGTGTWGGPVYGSPGIFPGVPVAPGGSPLSSVLEQMAGAAGGGAVATLGSPWSPGVRSARPKLFMVPNPVTGSPTWFRPAGRPILFSGDFAAVRRLRKVAGRARRRVGGR